MGYGDFQFYDIVVFAAIAVFLVFRLRKVLGRRAGFENNKKQGLENKNNHTENKKNEKNIPNLDDNYKEIKRAYEILDSFDHKVFLDGAKNAFEIIINAFNKGDNKTLRNLLTDEVFNVFKQEIYNKNNKPESQIYSLNIQKVENVFSNQDKITISVKFVSEHFKNNDERTVEKKEDVWSFEKKIKSKDPIWLLCST